MAVVFSLLILTSCASSDKIASKEDRSLVYFSHGTQYLVEKDYIQALTLLSQAYDLDPNNSEITNNLGMAYYFRGSVDQAIKYLKISIKQNPNNMDARNNLASVYLEQKNYTQALEEYAHIEKELTYEAQYKTFYNISLAHEELGNLAESIHYVHKSLQENSNYCPALFKLAMFSYKSENYKKALELFKKAMMGTCVQLPAPHFYTGKTLVYLKEYLLAHKKFTEVTEKFSDTEYFRMADREIKKLRSIIDEDERFIYENSKQFDTTRSFKGLNL